MTKPRDTTRMTRRAAIRGTFAAAGLTAADSRPSACLFLAKFEAEYRCGFPVLKFDVRLEDVQELDRLAASNIVPESAVKVSAEGYRRAIVRDPDGYRICLFATILSA